MAGIFAWSSTAASNTSCDGIDIQTNMSVANVDNVFRAMMALIRSTFASGLESFLSGAAGLGVANGGTGATTLTGILKGNGTSAVTAIATTSATDYLAGSGAFVAIPYDIQLKVTDDASAVAAGTGQAYIDILRNMTAVDVVATLATAQTGGSTFTVDINQNGTSILSTKLTVDNGETTSTSAATPAVISTATLTAGDRITIDVDGIGDGTAEGLVVSIKGTLR